MWSDSGDDSSSDEQDNINMRTELGQNTVQITQILSDLFKLSFKIRNPATRASGQSKPLLFKQLVRVDDTSTIDLLDCFKAFDRGHVDEALRELRRSVRGRPSLKDVYLVVDSLADNDAGGMSPPPLGDSDGQATEPEEEPRSFLVDRWSKSLTNRRRYFAYWENHARKLAREDKDQADSKMPDWTEAQPPMPARADTLTAALMTLPVAAPSLAGKTILSGTEVSMYERTLDDGIGADSVVSYASTAWDIDGTVADLPRAPLVEPPQTEFQCPYCRVTCPARHAKGKSWRLVGLFSDL